MDSHTARSAGARPGPRTGPYTRRMSTSRPRGCVLAAICALGVILTGCVSTSSVDEGRDGRPSPVTPTPSPSGPSPSPTTDAPLPPYAVPVADPQEVARLVHVAVGPGGAPQTSVELSAEAEADVTYAVEYDCRPTGAPVTFEIAWRHADSDAVREPGEGGSLLATCDGPAAVSGIVFANPALLQLSLTDADGIEEAWVRMLPAR